MNEKPRFGFAIEYVDDVQAAARFYTEVMGLAIERQHPTFVQFEHFAVASDDAVGGSRELELYWLVNDVHAARAALPANAEVTKEITELPFGKVLGVKGPTGKPRFLLELAANRPSKKVG